MCIFVSRSLCLFENNCFVPFKTSPKFVFFWLISVIGNLTNIKYVMCWYFVHIKITYCFILWLLSKRCNGLFCFNILDSVFLISCIWNAFMNLFGILAILKGFGHYFFYWFLYFNYIPQRWQLIVNLMFF